MKLGLAKKVILPTIGLMTIGMAVVGFVAYAISGYESINLADIKGNVVASSNPELVGLRNIQDDPFFVKAGEEGFGISDLRKGVFTEDIVFIIYSPIKTHDQPAGVLFGILNLDVFNAHFMESIKIGHRGFSFLVASDGQFIYHSDQSSVMGKNIADFPFGEAAHGGKLNA